MAYVDIELLQVELLEVIISQQRVGVGNKLLQVINSTLLYYT